MHLWKKKKKQDSENNRIKLILAIIFLFCAAIIIKLYYLQISKNEYYTDFANTLHQSFSILEPRRGRIFLEEKAESLLGSKYYPVATNKNFAHFFAKPYEIKNPELMSKKIYYVIDRPRIIDEVNEEYKKRVQSEATTSEEKIIMTKEEEELEKNEKNFQVKLRKEKILSEYLNKLNKGNDPYEPIANKVDEETLIKLYAILDKADNEFKENWEDEDYNIDVSNYMIKEEKVFKLVDGKEVEIKLSGFDYIMKRDRYYPENNIGSNVLGFVSTYDNEVKGNYGLEGFFNKELSGNFGKEISERGAGGSLVIINDREYEKPQDGSDLILTIDRTIQYTACQKLNEAVKKHGADGGSVIILEPKTGAVIAMCSYPDYDPNNYNKEKDINVFNNPAIFSQYEPGSIFKVITMAAGLDQGKIMPESTYNDTGSVKIKEYTIKNSDNSAHGISTMNTVLELSLNTGVIHVSRLLGFKTFSQYVSDFGFGEKTGIELEGESKGSLKNLNDKYNSELSMATASFGQGLSVTPLQMATAFASIANNGILMKPYIVKEIVNPNGEKIIAKPMEIRRVISERSANLLAGMMVNVVENGHGQRAGVKGYYVAGKTGTAQVPKKGGGYEANAHIGSFAGFAPVDNPAFAMIVRIDNPRDVSWAESSAAPLFGEIADFILKYKEIPAKRNINEKK